MLKGKVALVTGASRGIGRAIAEKLAQHGADIAINYYGNHEAAREVQECITNYGRKSVLYQSDVGNYNEAKKMIDRISNDFGRIDILINNAGILKINTITCMSPKDWHDVINTNLTGVFNLCQLVAPFMIKQKYGKIVNISSLASIMNFPASYGYTSSKAGVVAFSRVLSTELIGHNINVNAIAPGMVITDMLESLDKNTANHFQDQIPAKRFCDAEEVAELAYFLCQDISRYIVGQTIVIDGGLSL